ncbi:hypothetical protein K525DRAFT_245119 [Schizophyllum commune Loenen D]|nr:hypothetical protein K525DRAFT_245119 [Schizophyllum commune Loenen D]
MSEDVLSSPWTRNAFWATRQCHLHYPALSVHHTMCLALLHPTLPPPPSLTLNSKFIASNWKAGEAQDLSVVGLGARSSRGVRSAAKGRPSSYMVVVVSPVQDLSPPMRNPVPTYPYLVGPTATDDRGDFDGPRQDLEAAGGESTTLKSDGCVTKMLTRVSSNCTLVHGADCENDTYVNIRVAVGNIGGLLAEIRSATRQARMHAIKKKCGTLIPGLPDLRDATLGYIGQVD